MKVMPYESQPDDKTVRIMQKLVPNGTVIVAVNEDGKEYLTGALCILTDKGQIARCRDIDPELGFDLDGEGRIKLEGED